MQIQKNLSIVIFAILGGQGAKNLQDVPSVYANRRLLALNFLVTIDKTPYYVEIRIKIVKLGML